MSENPYKSPQADISREAGLNKAGAPPPEKRKTLRWRVVPSALLWLFGGIFVVCGISFLITFLFRALSNHPDDALEILLGIAISISWLFWGIAWCVGSHMIWRRRWLVATLAVGFGVACLVGSLVIAEILNRVMKG